MPVIVVCTGCAKRLKAKDTLAGKIIACPNCSTKLTVPLPDAEDEGHTLKSEPIAPPPLPPASESSEPESDEDAPAPPKKKPARPMVPLKSNEPPLWLRHLHWLLIVALLPLAFSLLHKDDEGFVERFNKSLENASPETLEKIMPIMAGIEEGRASIDDLIGALPGQKLTGAMLPRKSWAHWGMAFAASVVFMGFFILLATGGVAEPSQLLKIGLFTATFGILLLLAIQRLADWSQGFYLSGGNILVVIFYIFKFIGFSYRAALDPTNSFLLSFLGYTFGVGFCEEVCKALPLLVLYRHPSDQSWRGAFLWGLASGAGFGISEGIMYSATYYNGIQGPSIYVVRFVSCVALHALWTGSVAIMIQQNQHLLQQVESWYEYIPPLYFMVGIPMVLHGLYDTLLKRNMDAAALAIAVLSFLFLAVQISYLHGADDDAATEELLEKYKRQKQIMSDE